MKKTRYSFKALQQLFLGMLLILPMHAWTQIGIGTTSPHPSSMLHITAGAGSNKGLIMPSVASGDRVVLDSTQNIANGLVLFDSDLQKHYYFNNSPKQWFELDHDWIRKDVAGGSPVIGTHIYTGVPGNVGIGTAANVNPTAKLTVVGNQSIGSTAWTQDSVPPANSLIVQTWVGIGTATRSAGQALDVKGNVTVSNNVNVGNTVTAGEFIGKGVVPSGIITMWSGTINNATNFDANGRGVIGTKYEGWQICNGYGSAPDLRGRFIVGASTLPGLTTQPSTSGGYANSEYNKTDYNAINKNGGEADHVLTSNEMPSHTHTSGTLATNSTGNHNHSTSFSWGNGAGSLDRALAGSLASQGSTTKTTSSTGNHTHTISGSTGAEGNGQAHENRPPYYVLAYVIKL